MVRLQLRLTSPPQRVHETIQALRMQGFSARLDSRCVQVSLYRDLDQPDAVCYMEDWSSTEALEAEIRSDHFSNLLSLMETAAEPPVLQFRFGIETRGLDYVAEVRGEGIRAGE